MSSTHGTHLVARIILCLMLMAVLDRAGAALAQKSSSDLKGQNSNIFSGVVEEVDTKAAKLLIKTDVGKDVDLEVLKPELLKDIDKGDRVTVTVDEKQRATKVMKNIPIPELPPTTSPTTPETERAPSGGR